MIDTETELILKWSQNCVLTGKARRNEIAEGDDPAIEPSVSPIDNPTKLEFNITYCKLYVPVVSLQEKYDNELLKVLKTGISFDYVWCRY